MTSPLIYLEAPHFQPLAEELDENSDDYMVNEGTYGKALGGFLTEKLAERGHEVKFACSEDWGRYHELEHDEPFALAFGCSMHGDGHLIQFMPHEPYVRRWFTKLHAKPKVDALRKAVWSILESETGVSNLRYEKE